MAVSAVVIVAASTPAAAAVVVAFSAPVIVAGHGSSSSAPADTTDRPEAVAGLTEADGQPQLGMGVAIPFGPWLALGGLVYFLIMRGPTDAYLDTLTTIIFSPLGLAP